MAGGKVADVDAEGAGRDVFVYEVKREKDGRLDVVNQRVTR